MAAGPMELAVRRLRRVCDRPGDGQLLSQFINRRDESAFAELVRRHGPMVLGVCRRALANPHDADDAFQAAFLVLARKASSVRPRDRVGPWLYGVARRTALRVRARRRPPPQPLTDYPSREQPPTADVGPLIDEELGRLPDRYRAPLVLCLLEGLSRREAAGRLGLGEGTLSGQLARAKSMLAERLRRRGVAPAVAGGVLTAAVPEALAAAAVRSAAGGWDGVSAGVIALTEGVVRAMGIGKWKAAAAVALVAVAGVGFGVGGPGRRPAATAEGPAPKAKAEMAYVIEPPDVLKIEYTGKGRLLKQQLTGEKLVRPDGFIDLGVFGQF